MMRRRRAGGRRAAAVAALAAAAAVAVLLFAAPSAYGQGASIKAPLPEASVPSLAVTLFEDGGASVVHEVGGGGHDRAVRLLGGGDGPVGIEVVYADGGAAVAGFEVLEDGAAVAVPPTGEDVLVRYALEGALEEPWPRTYSWSFLYRATTSFTLPDSVDIAFVNGRAVYFTGAKAFNCHGCQMDIEFTVDESKGVQRFELGGGQGQGGPRAFDIEVWTSAQVGALALDPASKTIAYEVGGFASAAAGGSGGGGGRWVTLLIPSELLGPPYQASIDGERAAVTTFDAGDGRFGVSVRPAGDGEVRITGDTAASWRPAEQELGGGAVGEQERGDGEAAAAVGEQERGDGEAVVLYVALAGLAAGGAGAAAVLLSRKRGAAARRGRAP